MHAFIYRLVERLTEEGPPLSRNRHFHTFDSPEGKQALRIARRLRSVAGDFARATAPVLRREEPGGERRIRLEIPMPSGLRIAWLSTWEWKLLCRMLPACQQGEQPP